MERAVLRVEHAVTKANQTAGGGFLLRNNQLQGVHHGGHLPGGERRAQTLKQPGHIPGKVLWRQHLPDTIFITGQKLAVGIDRERLAVMLIDTHGLFAGTHGGKLRFAHGVERAFSRWPDGIINGLTGATDALREALLSWLAKGEKINYSAQDSDILTTIGFRPDAASVDDSREKFTPAQNMIFSRKSAQLASRQSV